MNLSIFLMLKGDVMNIINMDNYSLKMFWKAEYQKFPSKVI